MTRLNLLLAVFFCLMFSALVSAQSLQAPGARVYLADGWNVRSSADVQAGGEEISRESFQPSGWYHARIPATVLAVELQNGRHGDIFTSTNFRSLPGGGYPLGADFGNMPMPANSPYAVSWWYRKVFTSPATAGRRTTLHLDGIIYRANVWLNGRQIATKDKVAGAFRVFEFDVTDALKPGRNCLAVELFPTQLTDLGMHWVDWNPAPPDKNMGIWHDVYLTNSGPVTIRSPFVASKVDADLKAAHLTVAAYVNNVTGKTIAGTLRGSIGSLQFSRKVSLEPGETKAVTFTPDEVAALNIQKPALWWPTQMGPQNLHTLDVRFEAGGSVSDRQSVRFGIREVTSELTKGGYRLFKVNGRPVLIKGGAWAPDMLLRSDRERQEAMLRYAKDLNLNAIRLEGKLEDDHFYEVCDREGILVMPGWCCCDHWERTAKWQDEQRVVAEASMRDQARRLRSHPSVFVWLYGSDNPPVADVEQIYLRVLDEEKWPNPSLSSATAKLSSVTGPTGVKMSGPYEYVPPSYWYVDEKRGGAYGYNTETSPGPAVPPIESLRKMLGSEDPWPMDEIWAFHAGSMNFKTLKVFTEALEQRYGKATGAADYAKKAQALAYETHRAMFEAYISNKYHSTGVIQWLQNNAWPSMIWHLYDYYLRPGGSYFGAKKANEPLHILYSYNDRSVVVANSLWKPFKQLKASVRVLNLDMTEKFSREANVDVPEDGIVRVTEIPEISGLTTTYFVTLTLRDANRVVSRNFYWLSTKPDELDHEKGTWFYTPAKSHADVTALTSLPETTLRAAAQITPGTQQDSVRVTVKNTGKSLSFFTHLALIKAKDDEELLPITWEDNYFPLLPGEERVITAQYAKKDAGASKLTLRVMSWNTRQTFVSPAGPAAPQPATPKAD